MASYSYIYGQEYYYRDDLMKLIDEVAREREELRPHKLLNTSFAQDIKNKILGIERPLRESKDKPFKVKDTWYNPNGTVMVAKDVGRV